MCTQARETMHSMDGRQYVDRTPPWKSQSEWQRTEINGESYVHGMANPRIEDG